MPLGSHCELLIQNMETIQLPLLDLFHKRSSNLMKQFFFGNMSTCAMHPKLYAWSTLAHAYNVGCILVPICLSVHVCLSMFVYLCLPLPHCTTYLSICSYLCLSISVYVCFSLRSVSICDSVYL